MSSNKIKMRRVQNTDHPKYTIHPDFNPATKVVIVNKGITIGLTGSKLPELPKDSVLFVDTNRTDTYTSRNKLQRMKELNQSLKSSILVSEA
ncbi:hypothetical protein [Paenibacillus glycanilyticus]|uniref:hypothetical protein n=1 Tax=Paenibacillus glycanilyticus TaxID=126569 RepID=UPI003EBC5E09